MTNLPFWVHPQFLEDSTESLITCIWGDFSLAYCWWLLGFWGCHPERNIKINKTATKSVSIFFLPFLLLSVFNKWITRGKSEFCFCLFGVISSILLCTTTTSTSLRGTVPTLLVSTFLILCPATSRFSLQHASYSVPKTKGPKHM